MALIGTAVGALINGFGSKPKVPDLPKLDPAKIQQNTIGDNLAAVPGLEALGSRLNEYNQSQQLGMLKRALEFALPGGMSKAQGIVDSQLSGEVPDDVNAFVQRQSAAQAMAGGYGGGSGLGRNLTLRDLGLTSLGMQQQGLANFQSLASLAAPHPAFDVTSMFFTPTQRVQMAFQDRSDRFNRNLMHAQVQAAPEPWKAALTQAIIQDEAMIMETIGTIAGAAAKSGAACWIARAVYGANNPLWRVFRIWLFTEAPSDFRAFYLTHGERIGEAVKQNARLRNALRPLFDLIVNQTLRSRYAH